MSASALGSNGGNIVPMAILALSVMDRAPVQPLIVVTGATLYIVLRGRMQRCQRW